jgi:hypothetical protein
MKTSMLLESVNKKRLRREKFDIIESKYFGMAGTMLE